MRWLPLLVLLALPVRASATSCFFGPTVTSTPAVGCDVVVWAYTGYSTDGPRVEVERDGELVDVAGERTTTQYTLSVPYAEYDCDGTVIQTVDRSEYFDEYRIELVDARAGETLYVDGQTVGPLTASGCIDNGPPNFTCGTTTQCDWPDEEEEVDEDPNLFDGAGCQTSGNSAGTAGLVFVGLAAWRRRRRVRAG